MIGKRMREERRESHKIASNLCIPRDAMICSLGCQISKYWTNALCTSLRLKRPLPLPLPSPGLHSSTSQTKKLLHLSNVMIIHSFFSEYFLALHRRSFFNSGSIFFHRIGVVLMLLSKKHVFHHHHPPSHSRSSPATQHSHTRSLIHTP